MKTKPVVFFRDGTLIRQDGGCVPASFGVYTAEEPFFSPGNAERVLEEKAAQGVNFLLLVLGQTAVAEAPEVYDEALLARLREILKFAEGKQIAVVLYLKPDASAESRAAYTETAAHTARRVKDCAALCGFVLPSGSSAEFSAAFAARFAAKHPFLQFFAAPGADLPETACTAEPETAETKNAGSFVPPQYWPEAWTGVLAGF